MTLVTLFVTKLPLSPKGVLLALYKSAGSLLDPGQAAESVSGGSHIVLLGWLFFVLVSKSCPRLRHA
jgi:hypothetical protein